MCLHGDNAGDFLVHMQLLKLTRTVNHKFCRNNER